MLIFLSITVFVVLGHQRHDLVITTAIEFWGLKVFNVLMTRGHLRNIFVHIVSGFFLNQLDVFRSPILKSFLLEFF